MYLDEAHCAVVGKVTWVVSTLCEGYYALPNNVHQEESSSVPTLCAPTLLPFLVKWSRAVFCAWIESYQSICVWFPIFPSFFVICKCKDDKGIIFSCFESIRVSWELLLVFISLHMSSGSSWAIVRGVVFRFQLIQFLENGINGSPPINRGKRVQCF